jgi:hypothetical protein
MLFTFVFLGQLRELVTTPSTGGKMFMVSPSYIQDFLRIILLVGFLPK